MMNQSKSLLRSTQNHDKWLQKNNVHPSQLKARKKKASKPTTHFGVAKDYYGSLSNTIAPPTPVKSIWETIRTGNESSETISAIMEKASRVGPAYNKGGNQLLSVDQIIYSGRK